MKLPFKPKISFAEIDYYLDGFREKLIENNQIYRLVEELINQAFPSYEDEYDKKWEYFYLPVRRSGKVIALPFGVMEYNKEFFVFFHLLGSIHIKKGGEKVEDIYKNIFSETLRFAPFIKRNKIFLKRFVPYDFRTGKVKGRYILRKLLAKKEKEKILRDYERHLGQNFNITEISLNEYLKTAAICYKAVFLGKAESLSPIDMYKA